MLKVISTDEDRYNYRATLLSTIHDWLGEKRLLSYKFSNYFIYIYSSNQGVKDFKLPMIFMNKMVVIVIKKKCFVA